jgi:phosphatidylserine/phosphatidylglycerophosphate/cardiolipin synthase-like enzyme
LNWADGNTYYNKYLQSAIESARKGVEVKILLDSRYVEPDIGPGMVDENSKIDNFDTVQYINRIAALENLTGNLEARICYLSGLENIHTKGVIVDHQKVLVSSVNWNYNSVVNNREVGVIIENTDLTEFYSEFFNHDWTTSKSITIPSPPNASERAILITEIYPDTYLPWDPDEYIAITNPTNDTVDISGWVITDKLTKYTGSEGNIFFPVGTFLTPRSTIYLTRNASAFYREYNFLPDFEYIENSRIDVPQMELIDSSTGQTRGIQLANKGDEVVLGDEYLYSAPNSNEDHIIDMVIYGNSTFISDRINISKPFTAAPWYGRAVYNTTEGEIFKRNKHERQGNEQFGDFKFIDTNSVSDWESPRVYHPGQSEFWFDTIEYTGSVKVFSSPDSSYGTIVTELDAAHEAIYLSIYQFHNPYLMDKLINASLRGVDVKVLLDGAPVGGITDAARFVAQQLTEAGCEVRLLWSITDEDIHRRYRFLHTKYLVIDNFTTIIMSENWKTSGVPVDNTYGNRGWGVVVRNFEFAGCYSRVFFHDWNPQRGDSYAYNASDIKTGNPPEDFDMSWWVDGGYYKPRFQSRTINGLFKVTPVVAPDTTMNMYGSIIEMINSATESVYIEQLNCYINWNTKNRKIDNQYLNAAIDAARRGCEVKILLDSAFASPDDPGLDNYDTVEYINSLARRENLEDILQAKLIYLGGRHGRNQLEKVHNKGIIVDGKKTLVSSINWATGSVIYNREAGVIIENREVAQFFTEIFYYDWNLSVQEKIECYVQHSDTRDLTPGSSTEYIITLINTQPVPLELNLSITGFKTGWTVQLAENNITLPPMTQNTTSVTEVSLRVTAPTNDYIDQLGDSSSTVYNDKLEAFSKLELGLRLETQGMAADVVYITTNLIETPDPEPGSEGINIDDQPLDRSLVDPWLVVVILAILLIFGAVVRDVLQARVTKGKKGKKSSKKEMEENVDEVKDLEE